MNYHWNWGIFLEQVKAGEETYLHWLATGLGWTLAVSLAAWVLLPAHPATAIGFALAALLHAARLGCWQPWRTRARPILWVLHAAYAWLPVGFGLLAGAQIGRASCRERV